MASMKYTSEQLHYFRVCYVTKRIIANGLKTTFKREWDARYQATHGQWQDTAKNGIDFESMESAKSKKRNARLLAVMKLGNSNEWDCTCLFYAILFSDSLGPVINATVKKSVDELRVFRNNVFAHGTDGKLTDTDFKTSIDNTIAAFTALKLDTTEIEEIKNQTSFPTEELEDIMKQLEKEKKQSEEPRPFCVLPAKPSHQTIKRLNELEEIYNEMERLKNIKKNEVTLVYLSGNPGCGKSEVARQVGERFFNDKIAEINFVMTLNASSINTLLQSYVEFANRVGCNEDVVIKIKTSEGRSTEEKLNDLKCCIAPRLQGYSSWLIIVDNVSDLKAVCKYWPQAGEKTIGVGQILVTIQNSSSIPSDLHTYHLSLKEGMNTDDAVKALSDMSGLPKSEITLEVAKSLDFQPLALACAAVYMKIIKGSDWSKYLHKLEEGKREETEKPYQKTSLAYSKTMTAAVKMAVEKEANENEVLRHAFQFLSVIAPETISLNYVVQYVMNSLPDEDEDIVASTVCSSSLVLSSDEDKEVHVHQVVHSCLQVIVLNVKRDVYVEIIWNTILAFSEIKHIDLDDISDVAATRSLLEHFATLSSKIQTFMEFICDNLQKCLSGKHVNVDVSECLYNIQNICYTHGRFEAAEIIFKTLLVTVENVCDNEDPKFAALLNNTGNNLYCLGRYKEAMEYITRALVIEDNSYGDSHLTRVATLNNLGRTLCEFRKYDEAMKYVERSLSIQEQIYGKKHPLWSKTISLQGYIYKSTGRLEKAKVCFEKTLAINEMLHGKKRHTDMNNTLNHMGCLLRDLGQLDESKRYIERAIEITESLYDEKHPDLAASVRNLGDTLTILGQFEAAQKCFHRALSIEKRKYGVDKHPLQAITLDGLGQCLLHLGKYEDSKSYFKRALNIREKVYHDDESHPSLLGTMNNLACTLLEMKQYEEAYILLENVLQRQEHLFEEKDPEFAITLFNNLANTLEKMKEFQRSDLYLEEALAVQESNYAELSQETIVLTLNNLGRQKLQFGQYDKSEVHLNRAIAIQERISPDHPNLAFMLVNIGTVVSFLGRYEEATTHLKRALAIQERVYADKQHPGLSKTLRKLANHSLHLERYEEASSCLERALSINERYYGKYHPEVADSLIEFGRHLFEMKEYGKAITYLQRALSIQEKYYGKQHSQIAITLHNLGETYLSDQQYEQALVCLEKASAIESSLPDEEHPQMAETLRLLGIGNLKLRRYKESRIYLEKALKRESNTNGETSGLGAAIRDKLSLAISEEKKQEQKQKREKRQQQKQERQERHKQKYAHKRK